jgi:hypothetical protein
MNVSESIKHRAKTQILAEFAAIECKTQYQLCRTYDWPRRYLARAYGNRIPMLVGDYVFIPRKHINVTDDYGTWRGTSSIEKHQEDW